MANKKRLIDANELLRKHKYDIRKWGEPYAVMISSIENAPTVDAVPLSEVYRVIAGHSNYHGDNILAALTCISEGKEVKPVSPLPSVDAVEVVHGRWKPIAFDGSWRVDKCSICYRRMQYVDYDQPYQYCPNCGAKMDGGNEDG